MATVSKGGEDRRAAAARRTLELWASNVQADGGVAETGGPVEGIALWGLQVLDIRGGRALCAFRVSPHLTDGDGNWRAGAIAVLMDHVAATAIATSTGIVDVSVNFDISYFLPAKVEEEVEVEVEATVQHDKGLLTCVQVVIRKKGSGAHVALGKQWMSPRGLVPRL